MDNLIKLNQHRWEQCKVDGNKGPLFKKIADRLTAPAAVARYKSVEAKTKVPWWFIAVVHEREASQRWDRSLAQGDPWNQKSVHRPAGRGPFKSWEDAAYDALVNCAPYAALNKDWSPGGALTMLEKYNGLGYYSKGVPSPYVWAGTNQYSSGKYIADGVYSASTVDSQLGCAGLLKFMGVFGSSKPIIAPLPTTTTTAGAVIGGTIVYHYWPHFSDHWIFYTVGALIAAIVIDIAIHVYRNRKT